MVLNDPIVYPKDMNIEFKDLLASLLEKDPDNRIAWPDLALHPFVDADEEADEEFDEGVISDDGEEEFVKRLDSGIVVGWEKVDETLKADRYFHFTLSYLARLIRGRTLF
jgi:serine/threonine protein kinase